MKKILILLCMLIGLHAQEMVNIKLNDLEIKDFIQLVAKIKNKNILMENVRGKVEFVSVKPIPKEALLPVLVEVLNDKGYSLVETKEGYLKVVRGNNAIRENPYANKEDSLFSVKTFYLQKTSVRKIDSSLRRFLSKYGSSIINDEQNSIIVVDYNKNIEAITKVVKEMDSANEKELIFVQLKYVKPSKLSKKIEAIAKEFFASTIATEKVAVIDDDNSKFLVLIGKRNNVLEIEKLIKKFDVSGELLDKEELEQPQVKVIRLKHTDVADILKLLQDIYSKKTYDKDEFRPQFTSNTELNALIALSTKKDLLDIEKVIVALDIEKPQVYVKAQIIEISNSKSRDFGNELGIEGGVVGNGLYTFAAKLGGDSIPISSSILTSLQGTLGNIKQGLAIGSTLHMLETRGAAKVFSEPTVICTNNKESTIYIGQTLSVLVSSTTDSSSTSETKNSYQREDIGLTLKVTPRISSDNKVSMSIDIIAEEAQGSISTDKPVTSKRQVTTNAVVKNGETIVLGGLAKQTEYKDEVKVPLLGDIYFIGNLFKYEYTTYDDVDLVVLITPYVINTTDDFSDFKDKMAQYELLQNEYNKMIKKRYGKKSKKEEEEGSSEDDDCF